ncbi:unnamed protein product [Lactuca virosa]|uniref:Uncharacterized protein n=1 Tax=Lactuca virosa TaxID=75947 RepID=A0AAU9MDS8_9ASTR|nr:unnamed protein product [Lactuca virosa]
MDKGRSTSAHKRECQHLKRIQLQPNRNVVRKTIISAVAPPPRLLPRDGLVMPPSTTTSSPPWAYITYAAPEFRVPHAYESRAAQSSAIGGVGMSSLTGVEHSYVGLRSLGPPMGIGGQLW